MHIVSMITFIINSLRWLQKMQDHSPIFIQCFPISSYSRNESKQGAIIVFEEGHK